MIVFNGETFLHELLESIYDFAYEIVVVEGPDQNSLPMAGPDGGSTDRTLEILRSYPDPEGKLRVIRGTWRDKDEQSNRYMDEVSGDYIWQVDDDEIYKPEDLVRVAEILRDDPKITAASFYWQNFFKGFDRVMVAEPPYEVWRLFRLGPGYRFVTHRPPTVIDPATGGIMNTSYPLRASMLAEAGIYIYHYSYVYDDQVRAKIRYHTNYRLGQLAVGIPALPRFLARSGWTNRAWKAAWNHRLGCALRRRRDRSFHYDYFDKIWTAWDRDPRGIEERYGVSPGLGPYRRTAPFTGTHPEAISRRRRGGSA
jgi:glycosyltransferase involved in cell wall biosynthesis